MELDRTKKISRLSETEDSRFSVMSLSLCLNHLTSHPFSPSTKNPVFNPTKPTFLIPPRKFLHQKPLTIRSSNGESELSFPTNQEKPKWEKMVSDAASLYPIYVTLGGVVAYVRPSTFSWFIEKAPTSYSLGLGFIMLSMGLTLELKDLINLFLQNSFAVSL